MAAGVPAAVALTCPRCHYLRAFENIDGGQLFRCSGCEWSMSLSTQAPTGVTNAVAVAGAVAISVASGGAAFTSGMKILWDTGANAEVVTATATGSATSIPVTAALKGHASGSAIGQLLTGPTYSGAGLETVPPAPGYGF